MKVVLIDGADTYHCVGVPTIHIGQFVEVSDEIGRNLLAARCPTGPMFLKAEAFDYKQVSLRLVDPRQSFRTAAIYADNASPIQVSASIAPFLLRQRRNGEPIFRETTD